MKVKNIFINNYSWESIEIVLNSYDNNVDTGWANLISLCDLLKFKEAASKYSKVRNSSQSRDGSYSKFWHQVSNKFMSKFYLKNKIKERHNTINIW